MKLISEIVKIELLSEPEDMLMISESFDNALISRVKLLLPTIFPNDRV